MGSGKLRDKFCAIPLDTLYSPEISQSSWRKSKEEWNPRNSTVIPKNNIKNISK